MDFHFSKYVGCGNDFILIDDRLNHFPIKDKNTIARLCHRNYGIGADGLILLQRSSRASFRMRIFNADGTEAEMCGNGLRCLMKFVLELGFSDQASYSIETMHSLLLAEFFDQDVKIEMGQFTSKSRSFSVDWNNETLQIHSLNTGVPHAVIFVDDLNRSDFTNLGSHLRHSPLFGEAGTNVNIAQLLNSNEIAIRSYERGVEGETLACGTGATAVALAAAGLHNFASPVTIRFRSQEKLVIQFQKIDSIFSKITMTGPAYCSFRGINQI